VTITEEEDTEDWESEVFVLLMLLTEEVFNVVDGAALDCGVLSAEEEVGDIMPLPFAEDDETLSCRLNFLAG
jgi:hypothetical protein